MEGCSEYIPHGGIGAYCRKKPTRKINGKWYCKLHEPDRVKARFEKRMAIEKAESQEATRQRVEREAIREQHIRDEGRVAGIREVVEWMVQHSPTLIAGADVFAESAGHSMKQDISYYPIIKLVDWQAKLKEWGIE